jgi:hypothetical protein
MIGLVIRLRLLEVPTDAAVVDEPAEALLIYQLLLRLQHIVTFATKSHPSECHLDVVLDLLIFN